MDLTTYATGIQHIGIPTNDIETTIAFYHKLGFETALETVNEEANERVAFLKLGTLVIETYENKSAKLEAGAIDHVAIDVKNIEEIYFFMPSSPLKKNEVTNRIRFASLSEGISERAVFARLKKVRLYFAERRGLFTGDIPDFMK